MSGDPAGRSACATSYPTVAGENAVQQECCSLNGPSDRMWPVGILVARERLVSHKTTSGQRGVHFRG